MCIICAGSKFECTYKLATDVETLFSLKVYVVSIIFCDQIKGDIYTMHCINWV